MLPSGDPGSDTTGSTVTYPKPREGSAAFSYPLALVGEARTTSSDTIVFGGRDVNGNYLNDLWLLRAYLGSITETNGSWAGIGNGNLETGVDASGAGVTVQYMTACASAIREPSGSQPSSSQSSRTMTSTSSGTPMTSNPQSSVSPNPFTTSIDASIYHKLLSPLSVALLLLVVVAFRLEAVGSFSFSLSQSIWYWLSMIVLLVAYALGVAGIVTAFSPINTTTVSIRRRAASSSILQSSHAKAGLIFFLALYGGFPLIFLVVRYYQHRGMASLEGFDGDGGKTSKGTSSAGLQINEKHDVANETQRHGMNEKYRIH